MDAARTRQQHRLADGFIHNGARIVGVVIRLGGHGKDRAGIDLHHNAHRTGRHMMLRHGGTERTFQIVLDVRPDGQSDIIPWHGILQGTVMGISYPQAFFAVRMVPFRPVNWASYCSSSPQRP